MTVCSPKSYFFELFVFNTLSVTKNPVTVSDSWSSVTNCHQNLSPTADPCILLKKIKIKIKYKEVSPSVTRFLVTDIILKPNGLYAKNASVTGFVGGLLPFRSKPVYAGSPNFRLFLPSKAKR